MKALVIGATGATGQDLISLLLADNAYDSVDVFVRRAPDISHDKLHVHVVDFEKPNDWAEKVCGDVAFSCMGTTLKSAGSKEAQWKVDYVYQLDFAQNALKNGVREFILVSSMSAKANSGFFYMRMKGLLEEDIRKLGFHRLIIVRPPSLVRKNTDRLSEKIGMMIIRCFNRVGLLKRMAPMKTETVARAMLELSKHTETGVSLCEESELRKYEFYH